MHIQSKTHKYQDTKYSFNFLNVNSEKALCESIIYMLSTNKTVLKLLISTYFATECFWRLLLYARMSFHDMQRKVVTNK